MKKLLVIAGAVVLMAGCDLSEQKTVQYYLAHLDEAAKRIESCRSGGDTSQDCKNASEAAAMSIMSPLGGKTTRVQSIAEIEAEERAKEAAVKGGQNGTQK